MVDYQRAVVTEEPPGSKIFCWKTSPGGDRADLHDDLPDLRLPVFHPLDGLVVQVQHAPQQRGVAGGQRRHCPGRKSPKGVVKRPRVYTNVPYKTDLL